MNSQLKRGTLELCVLSIVSKGDCYGYELVNTISTYIHITEGTIYPLLKRLRDGGKIESYLVESSEGPARKYYKITSLGQKELEALKKQWEDFVITIENLLNNPQNQ